METIALSTPPVVSGALPLLGHLTEFSKNRTALIERGYAEHGSIFTVKLGPHTSSCGRRSARSCFWPGTMSTYANGRF